MTGPGDRHNVPPEQRGAATAAKGTPVPVDVGVDPRARSSVAVLLAGPVILIVHFLVVYLVAEAGCTGDGPGLDVFDPPVPTVATVVATVVAAAASSASALWGYRRWRSGGNDEPPDHPPADHLVDRAPLGFVGFLLSLLSLVTVLLVGVPALLLGAC
jgi:hypothetical protein